jgi:hypothetical protein
MNPPESDMERERRSIGPLRARGVLLLALVLGSGCAGAGLARAAEVVAAESPRQEPDPDAGYRSEFYAAKGVYLGARGHWSHLEGDFDGDTALVGFLDTIFLPDAEDDFGYELALGWLSEGWGMELTYSRITYDGELGGASADVESQAISWNGLRYLRGNEPLQPYFLFGFSFPWMDLEDASTDGAVVGDAELSNGLGLNLGLGLAWWLGHHLATDIRGTYTYQSFGEAEGVAGDSDDIDDAVEGHVFGLSIGLTWVVGKSR